MLTTRPLCNPRPNHGFSLMEMTVVLLVLAVISTMGISVFREKDYGRKMEETRKRLATIENALMNYRNSNQRLPCPANGSIADGALNYGFEGKYAGTCMDADALANGLPNSNFASGETVAGVIPTRTLQLPDDYMLDAWGRRITYVVDRRMTHIQATLKFGVKDCNIGSITINDASGAPRTTRAVYALISHGENGHGAFLSSGARRNFKSTNTGEQTNAHYSNTGAVITFASTFLMKREEKSATNVFDSFDDIVTYKERWGVANAADLMLSKPNYLTQIISRGENPDHARTHTCAVDEKGLGYCWGQNGWEQLGDDTATNRNVPTAIQMDIASPSTLNGFVSVHPGASHSCGLGRDSKLYCWGRNQTGQTGSSWWGYADDPLAFPGGVTGYSFVTAGDEHTCAIATDNNRVYCTGNNGDGRLGDGTTTTRWAMTTITGTNMYQYVSAGHTHTCGITTDNKTYCWGSNTYGELGDGTTTARSSPTLVTNYATGVGAYKQVQAAGHDSRSFTCGLAVDSAIYCWGRNENGRFGNGSWGPSSVGTATKVTLPSGVIGFSSFSISAQNGCALDFTGNAYCWGNTIGDGSTQATNKMVPTLVTMPSGVKFTSITSGKNINCAIGTDKNAYCWGQGGTGVGQIGDGTPITDRLVPTRVPFPPCGI